MPNLSATKAHPVAPNKTYHQICARYHQISLCQYVPIILRILLSNLHEKKINTSQAVDMLDITGSRCHTPPMRGAPMMPPGIIIMPGLKSTNILGPKSQCGWHDVACVRTLRYESVRVIGTSNSHRAYSATPTLRKGNVQRNCRTEELLKETLSGQVLCLSLRISEFDVFKRCKRWYFLHTTRLFPFTRFLASWDSSLTCIKAPRWIKSKTNIYLRPFETTGWLENTEKKLKKTKKQ